MVDILIKNGRVIDPANGRDEVTSVAIRGNRIIGIGAYADADYVVDAEGCIVLPGLIDIHAHVFKGGSEHGVSPDLMAAQGVTTVNDAGTTGAANFEAFFRSVVTLSTVRVYTGLNLYAMGQPGYGLSEDLSPAKYPRSEIERLLSAYPEQIRSIKIRVGEEIVGEHCLNYVESAVDYCNQLKLPLVVHASNLPCAATEVSKRLRPGDVFCHCFHGKKNPILSSAGEILPGILDDRKRGVLFDCCNGRSNFACEVGREAIQQGFFPDFISTDLIPDYCNRNGFAKSLPYLMSKYLEIGMPLYDIISAVTARPAQWLKLPELGSLSAGTLADVTILKEIEAAPVFVDQLGDRILGHRLLKPMMTIVDGAILFSQIDF